MPGFRFKRKNTSAKFIPTPEDITAGDVLSRCRNYWISYKTSRRHTFTTWKTCSFWHQIKLSIGGVVTKHSLAIC